MQKLMELRAVAIKSKKDVQRSEKIRWELAIFYCFILAAGLRKELIIFIFNMLYLYIYIYLDLNHDTPGLNFKSYPIHLPSPYLKDVTFKKNELAFQGCNCKVVSRR